MNDAKVEEPIDDTEEPEGPDSEDDDPDEEQEQDDEEEAPSTERVEGEGSYAAARKYDADLEKGLREGKSEELPEKARKALEGPEGKA